MNPTISQQAKYDRFRETYTKLVYEDFSFQLKEKCLEVSFSFCVYDLDGEVSFRFNPKSVVNFEGAEIINSDYDEISAIVFHIGLAELISYWKAVCPKLVEIKPYALSSEQRRWWKKLYYNGLQEFFYLNGITPPNEETFMILSSSCSRSFSFPNKSYEKERFLVPIGGGKDSAVTLNLLKELGKDLTCLIINPRGASMGTVIESGLPEEKIVKIQRTIDGNLLSLNAGKHPSLNGEEGLNGHTPFSATLAYYSLIVSYVTSIKHIALSNESSADEPTVADSIVNHQYSKSTEFERDFRLYVKKYLKCEADYYSLLRPLNEMQIAKLFAQLPFLFETFKSCNVGSKEDAWCASCAKCMFTYIILSPYIPQDDLTMIFGKDMLNDLTQKAVFDQLIGITESKPFECVGTVEEVNTALGLAIKIHKENGVSLPKLLSYYETLDDVIIYSDINTQELESAFGKSFCGDASLVEFVSNKVSEQSILSYAERKANLGVKR